MSTEFIESLVQQCEAVSPHVRGWLEHREPQVDVGMLMAWVVGLRRIESSIGSRFAAQVATDLQLLEAHRERIANQIGDPVDGLDLDEVRASYEGATRSAHPEPDELFEVVDTIAQVHLLTRELRGPTAGAARALVRDFMERTKADVSLFAAAGPLALAQLELAEVRPGHPEWEVWDSTVRSAELLAEIELEGPVLGAEEVRALAARIAAEVTGASPASEPATAAAARVADRTPWTLRLRMAAAAIREALTLAPVHGYAGSDRPHALQESLEEDEDHALRLCQHGKDAWLEWEGANPPVGIGVELGDGRVVELARRPESDDPDDQILAWSWLPDETSERAILGLLLRRGTDSL